MEILVMIVMEDRVGLPRLPPVRFEIHSGVIDDAVIIHVDLNGVVGN